MEVLLDPYKENRSDDKNVVSQIGTEWTMMGKVSSD